MIITVASHKGGVGKTTTAVHLAAYLQTLAPTLLLDGDDTRNATAWNENGQGFPFKVADQNSAALLAPRFTHIVIDTERRRARWMSSEGVQELSFPPCPPASTRSGSCRPSRCFRRATPSIACCSRRCHRPQSRKARSCAPGSPR